MNESREPRAAARNILNQTKQFSPPVNLHKVLVLFPDLHVTVTDLDGDGAFVDLGVIGGEILLARKGSRVRRRFTLAHEIGHYVYVLSHAEENRDKYDAVEKWCNTFAAELLVPEFMLRNEILLFDYQISTPFTWLSGLSELFSVSLQNMCIRLVSIGPFSIFLTGGEVQQGYATNFPNLKLPHLTWKSEIYDFIAEVASGRDTAQTFEVGDILYSIERIRGSKDGYFVLVMDRKSFDLRKN